MKLSISYDVFCKTIQIGEKICFACNFNSPSWTCAYTGQFKQTEIMI